MRRIVLTHHLVDQGRGLIAGALVKVATELLQQRRECLLAAVAADPTSSAAAAGNSREVGERRGGMSPAIVQRSVAQLP